jgi:multiple antibiotic resistance protein
MKTFLLAFIPLLVAIDPFGTLPLFVGLTEGYDQKEKKHLALQAVTTAFIVGVLFGAAGHYVFNLLGITGADFRIAGGLLLLIFSIGEVFGRTEKDTNGGTRDAFLGVVPLGIPLVAGPATITTLLILHDSYPFLIVVAALAANLALSYLTFFYSDRIIHTVGEATSKVTAKIVAIFLAAIGIMMIRKGLEAILVR